MKRHHYLILTEESNLHLAEGKRRNLEGRDISCEIQIINRPVEWEKIKHLLSKQVLNTVVIIYADHEIGQRVKQEAVSTGFANESVTLHASPSKKYTIFCSQCQYINETSGFDRFSCINCGQQLEPTDHYSEYHRAFLGYPII